MCGITGFLNFSNPLSREESETVLQRMTDAIEHRGPDNSGAWIDTRSGIALGFRRLAILDLSPTGDQPMESVDGRFVIVFNGEIYNYSNLRTELLALGYIFRGTSDTEILLTAICQWGLTDAIKRANGMFAFALWDKEKRALHLVRDRLGIKPLYYGWTKGLFLFGSELKSLRANPAFRADIDLDALTLFMRFSYIPAPHTIYRGFYKLKPGCILTIQAGNRQGEEKISSYWSAYEAVENGLANPFSGSEKDAIDELEALISRSVRLRMIADVSLGAFLSGGVDSSTVVALMQKQSRIPIRTFTIGFHEAGFNEAEHARLVANHLGTNHTELYITPGEAQAVIPRLPLLFDEPFADPSQIPTFLISQLARQDVTVSLSGDGGDELFGGYNRYFWGARIWKSIRWMPMFLRRVAATGLATLSSPALKKILPVGRFPNPGDKLHKLSGIIASRSAEALYLDLISLWKQEDQIVRSAKEPLISGIDRQQWVKTDTFEEWMMSIDLVSYLPDDILVKVDRASMGVSLEARVPFLDDHEICEFAWRLPLHMKIRNGRGKWILRQVLYRHIPPRMIERPKMGFGVPIDTWLRGPLRDWAEDLLDEQRLNYEGMLNPEPIRRKWKEHLDCVRNWQYYLWNVLIFQSWLAENRPR